MDTFNKTQDTLIQAMLRIENNQVNQANLISERQKGTLLIQSLPNPRNFMQVNELQDSNEPISQFHK